MIIGTLRIPLSPHRRAKVLEVLRSVQGPVSGQLGCVSCQIYEELGPGEAVVFVERWASQEALEQHVRSEACRRIPGAIELASRQPEVCFDYVSASEGVELIERLRNLESTGWNAPRNTTEETTGPSQSTRAIRGRRKKQN
jgi:quinol monooxygenase YgiN